MQTITISYGNLSTNGTPFGTFFTTPQQPTSFPQEGFLISIVLISMALILISLTLFDVFREVKKKRGR
ncbi:hypothetical protein J5U23_01642 [Saccharolobus shibatae B12]|uniref:Uncharacterized protein n=2 Tax=Saccharolobus shibatae TaxID=2286 RepID=A0A8F5BNX9_SACSH|nr:hypothetical protein [Saccharolobus shibatae]QXJ28773.1 hypothetical protein J5U23_01642 [Saccharolobus shibatae B12]QXJ35073.1 hypothetical protein J5U22_01620 [Saccharolobus shibatae]